jgi:hypothetical protein
MRIEKIGLADELRRIAGDLDESGRRREPSYCASRYDTEMMRRAAKELEAMRERAAGLEAACTSALIWFDVPGNYESYPDVIAALKAALAAPADAEGAGDA